MGKRIIQQRRGKGSPTYRIPEKAFKPKIEYRNHAGVIVDLVNDPMRDAPLAMVKYEDNYTGYIVAVEGMKVGDSIQNFVRPISQVEEGSKVSSIETYPNSGPKLCRSPGAGAVLVSKSGKECTIMLPSKKKMKIHQTCMVMAGIPAGEGRKEKPMVKAGKKWIAMHVRGKLYPRTSAKAMNAYDHPFGSGYGGLGKAKTVSRNAPPGRKVGSLAAKRSGKKR